MPQRRHPRVLCEIVGDRCIAHQRARELPHEAVVFVEALGFEVGFGHAVMMPWAAESVQRRRACPAVAAARSCGGVDDEQIGGSATMIGYSLWVAAGIGLGAMASRWQGEVVPLPSRQRAALLFFAVGGAVLGAYGLQLPADLLGYAAPPPAGMATGDAMPLGGRTVLGGLIGGWIAVEFGKRLAGIRQPTGDGFALPLAIALGCGRMGCACAGCCAGAECAPHWWAWIDAAGTPRLPVQWIEAAFHFAVAIWLAFAARRRIATGRRLAIYLSLYAVVRFLLEFVRLQPAMGLGLTWHQGLAVVLLGIAGSAWWRRARSMS